MYHIIAVWCCVFQEVGISCSCAGYVSSWWYLTSPLDGGYIQCTFQLTGPQKSIFDSADRWSACVFIPSVQSVRTPELYGTFFRTLSKTLTIVISVLCDGRIMRRIYALLWPPMQTFISCQVVITDKCWCHKEWRLFGQILTKLWDQLLWLSSPQLTTLWWISVKGYCKSKNFANIWIGE